MDFAGNDVRGLPLGSSVVAPLLERMMALSEIHLKVRLLLPFAYHAHNTMLIGRSPSHVDKGNYIPGCLNRF